MQPKKGDPTRSVDDLDSESKWIRLTKQLFLDLAYMSLVSDCTSVELRMRCFQTGNIGRGLKNGKFIRMCLGKCLKQE